MEDGRMAVFLPIRGPRNDLAGTVMILADMKSMTEGRWNASSLRRSARFS